MVVIRRGYHIFWTIGSRMVVTCIHLYTYVTLIHAQRERERERERVLGR
jgi:hypothetical protein